MNKDKKLIDYLQMIENNQPSGIVSGAFIEEQPNLLHNRRCLQELLFKRY